MTRGKYAARAANARAESAGERATRLEGQLAEERAASAREIAGLKTEVQRLAGQLTTAVKEMSAAEVERVRTEALEQIDAARSDFVRRGRAAVLLLERVDMDIKMRLALEGFLAPDMQAFGEAMSQRGGDRGISRSEVRAAKRVAQGWVNSDATRGWRTRLLTAIDGKAVADDGGATA